MSEKSTASSASAPAPATLENQYKPVGIAALAAATLCKGKSAQKPRNQASQSDQHGILAEHSFAHD